MTEPFSVVMPYRAGPPERERNCSFTLGWWSTHFPAAEVVVGVHSGEPFCPGKARNAAVAKATHDLVVIADADAILNPTALTTALEMCEAGDAPWIIPFDRYFTLIASATDTFITDGAPADWIPTPGDYEHLITDSTSSFVARRQDLVAWPYDNRFVGWSHEDWAMAVALDTMVGPAVRLDANLIHLWHPRTVAEWHTGPQIPHNEALFQEYEAASRNRDRMEAVISAGR